MRKWRNNERKIISDKSYYNSINEKKKENKKNNKYQSTKSVNNISISMNRK